MNANEATATYICHAPGCTNEVRSRVGRYSYCEQHRSTAARKPRSGGDLAQRIAGLSTLAKQVDRARARAKRLTEQALTAKAHADGLEQRLPEALLEATNGSRS